MVETGFELLSKYKIGFPAYAVAKTPAEAVSSAQKIGFPVAMKILSPAALHKTDKGGVALGIEGKEGAEAAYKALVSRFSGSRIDGVLVQKMFISRSEMNQISSGSRSTQSSRRTTCRTGRMMRHSTVSMPMARNGAVELIVGGKRDSQFGQLLMLGMGGIFVEIYKDVTFRVCPITREDAYEMIGELKGYPILAGARGKKPIDLAALENTLMRVSELLSKENPRELDINPLMADGKGCVAVDVRILR